MAAVTRGTTTIGQQRAEGMLFPRYGCTYVDQCEAQLCACNGVQGTVTRTNIPNPQNSGQSQISVNRCNVNNICSVPQACMTAYLSCWAQQRTAAQPACPSAILDNWCCTYATYAGCGGGANAVCGRCTGQTSQGCVNTVLSLSTTQVQQCQAFGTNPDNNQRCDANFQTCTEARACTEPQWSCTGTAVGQQCTTSDLQNLCRLDETDVNNRGNVCPLNTDTGCSRVRSIFDQVPPNNSPTAVGQVQNVDISSTSTYPWWWQLILGLLTLLTTCLCCLLLLFYLYRRSRRVIIRRRLQPPVPLSPCTPVACPAPCMPCMTVAPTCPTLLKMGAPCMTAVPCIAPPPCFAPVPACLSPMGPCVVPCMPQAPSTQFQSCFMPSSPCPTPAPPCPQGPPPCQGRQVFQTPPRGACPPPGPAMFGGPPMGPPMGPPTMCQGPPPPCQGPPMQAMCMSPQTVCGPATVCGAPVAYMLAPLCPETGMPTIPIGPYGPYGGPMTPLRAASPMLVPTPPMSPFGGMC